MHSDISDIEDAYSSEFREAFLGSKELVQIRHDIHGHFVEITWDRVVLAGICW